MIDESTVEQPTPHGKGPDIAPLVCVDIMARSAVGEKKYGEPLKAFNGRDPIVDLYQELLDGAQYIRQMIEERKKATPGAPAGGRECWAYFYTHEDAPETPTYWAKEKPKEKHWNEGGEWRRMAEVVEPPPALPREALEAAIRYMSHDIDCTYSEDSYNDGPWPCSCGMEQARATLKGENHEA